MSIDTKEFSGCLGMEWKGEADGKDCKRAIGRLYGNGYVQYFDCENNTYVQNFIKWLLLSM